MNYTCQPYIYGLITAPAMQILISIIILSVLINLHSFSFIKKYVKSRWFRRDNRLKMFQIVLGAFVCLYGLVSSLAPLWYGIPLATEKDSDCMTYTGYVEHISESAVGSMKYRGDVYYPCILVLDGKEYFIMSREGLEEGNYIRISYLPKSTVVLSFEVLDAHQAERIPYSGGAKRKPLEPAAFTPLPSAQEELWQVKNIFKQLLGERIWFGIIDRFI